MEKEFIITPNTKVLQLIERYPELEDDLIAYIPAFSKLKNPLLRKTIARIATLRQAANIGNVEVSELVNRMRSKVGQDTVTIAEGEIYNMHKPAWFSVERIVREFDVKEMLSAGEHPVNQVMADLSELSEGKIYRLIAPFITAPLIDKATSLRIEHWIEQLNDDTVHIYFYRREKND